MSRLNLVNPSDVVDEPGFIRRLFQMLENLLNGRARNQGSVTLTANDTETVVDNPLFESHQTVVLSPLTANAAGVLAETYISARTNGQFTITHPNDADTDKDFEYVFIG